VFIVFINPNLATGNEAGWKILPSFSIISFDSGMSEEEKKFLSIENRGAAMTTIDHDLTVVKVKQSLVRIRHVYV
jgi:hypothetical protein